MIRVAGYLPIFTTLFCVFFLVALARHYGANPSRHMLWWAWGVAVYGIGTLVESLVTLTGWSPWLFRAWYISGAIFGGVVLAQGTAMLLMRPRWARLSSMLVLLITALATALVLLSPLEVSKSEPHRLSGNVLVWQQVRWLTPFINLYAFVLFTGGAAWSAWLYHRSQIQRERVYGNILIAVGGLLPGIGGAFSKFGHTEVLYLGEFVGILLIYSGYRIMRDRSRLMSVSA
jgi:hypothetical protein